jgi:hypothetical protein
MFTMGEVFRWRAWLGMGDGERLSQIDVAEFGSVSAARAWVERRLRAVLTRPGLAVYGSVDRGVYRPVAPGAAPKWQLVHCAESMDAALVDGQVSWRRPGSQ